MIRKLLFFKKHFFKVREDNVKGKCVFTTRNFAAGEYITEYKGELRSVNEMKNVNQHRSNTLEANYNRHSYDYYFFFHGKKYWLVNNIYLLAWHLSYPISNLKLNYN